MYVNYQYPDFKFDKQHQLFYIDVLTYADSENFQYQEVAYATMFFTVQGNLFCFEPYSEDINSNRHYYNRINCIKRLKHIDLAFEEYETFKGYIFPQTSSISETIFNIFNKACDDAFIKGRQFQ